MKGSAEGRYWFRSKLYGIGWGLPLTWQGWVVLGIYLGLLVVGGSWLNSRSARLTERPYLVAYVIGISLLFLFVCWLKGPPLKWRWGRRWDDDLPHNP